MGHNDLLGKSPQIGDRPVLQHGPHFKGRTGQHQHVHPSASKAQPGSGAHRIVEDHAIGGKLRLLAVIFRHDQVDVPGKISPNMLQHILPQDQRLAEGLADGLLGKIVIGGAKAAGGEDDVRPLPGDLPAPPAAVPGCPPTTVCQNTLTPTADSAREISLALVLVIFPRSSSVPTAMISAVCDITDAFFPIRSGLYPNPGLAPPGPWPPGRQYPERTRPAPRPPAPAGWRGGAGVKTVQQSLIG